MPFLGRPAALWDVAFSAVEFSTFRPVACDLCGCDSCALRDVVSREFVALANCTAAATALIPMAWYFPVSPEWCCLVLSVLFGIAVHRFHIRGTPHCTQSAATRMPLNLRNDFSNRKFRMGRKDAIICRSCGLTECGALRQSRTLLVKSDRRAIAAQVTPNKRRGGLPPRTILVPPGSSWSFGCSRQRILHHYSSAPAGFNELKPLHR